MILQILLLCVGFCPFSKRSRFFFVGMVASRKFAWGKCGNPRNLICPAITIVAMGTSLPEAAVSITFRIKGKLPESLSVM